MFVFLSLIYHALFLVYQLLSLFAIEGHLLVDFINHTLEILNFLYAFSQLVLDVGVQGLQFA